MSPLPIRTLPGYTWPPLPDAALSQVWAAYQELDRAQWLAPADLERRQLEQVRAVLAHALPYAPYYRQVLSGAGVTPGAVGTAADFRRLPLLRRRTYQERQAELCAAQLPPGTVAAGHTFSSGGSGIPVRVLQTNMVHLWWCACFLRHLEWCGFDPAGTLAAVQATGKSGADLERTLQGVAEPCWVPQLTGLLETGPLYLMDIQQDPRRQLQWLRKVAPDYLLSSPANLGLLAGLAAEGGPIPCLRGIQSAGESLGDEARSRLEAAFGVPVKDTYTCGEGGYLASPCPQGHGLHVHAENVLLEVLDESGRPCQLGETGKVFLTTLHNFRAAFVRYELMDEATVGPSPCPCGRGLPLLTRIRGKSRPSFCLPDGRRKSCYGLTAFLESLPGLRQFQVVQRAADRAVIRVAAGPDWSEEQAGRVRRKAAEFFEGLVRVDLEVKDSPGAPADGTFQCVVNEVMA